MVYRASCFPYSGNCSWICEYIHFQRVAALFRRGADESLDLQVEREDELIVIESIMPVSVDAHTSG